MKRFTVFGSTGFVGCSLTNYLKANGYDVLTPDRDANVAKLGHLGHIIYCIGLTGDFRLRPLETMQAHVSKLGDVMSLGQYDSLLYLSSTRVYMGNNSSREDTEIATKPEHADHLYNISKIAGEALCISGGSRHRVARLSNVVGPVKDMSDAFVSKLFLDAKSGAVHLQTHPQSEKDYIWIEDCVALLSKIAVNGEQRVYNVASGMQTNAEFWLDHVSSVTGCAVSVATDAELLSFPKINVARITSEFKFVATPPNEFSKLVI